MNSMKMSAVQKREMLVSFFDLTGFMKLAQQKSEEEVFQIISEFCEKSGKIIEENGGKVIKFIGDAGIAVFDDNNVDTGVKTLKNMKLNIDGWFQEMNLPCRLMIKLHFGSVMYGMIGTPSDKRIDIIGETVNQAATLKSYGFSMTAQVFRKLNEETRKLFKKHTPSIRYIPLDEEHKD